MRNCFFVVTVLLAAGAVLVACSDDDSSSSPLQPSPLATAPSGGGGGVNPFHLLAGDADLYGGPAAGLTAGANPGLSQLAPHTRGFNAYNARIEYVDGEVTITFVPVDMPGMPDAAREYRNRAVTVWQCPVEPHHVGQTCGEPVFRDSFAFLGSPSRTFPLADCAGWLVVEAAELSDDRHDGWRNAPLSCRTDDEGRAVASANTNGGGDGWEDSRFDPPVRGPAGSAAPTITNPGDRSYGRGMAITAFLIMVTSGTVTVEGLPDGLTWSGGMVSGTVSSSAAVRDYRVTVTANDGVNDPVTAEFTITVIPTWILLADSLAANRGNMGFPGYPFTGAGPDNSSGWPLRWARWYYAEGEPGWTIVQFYSEGSWAFGGSYNVGCSVTGPGGNPVWTAELSPSGAPTGTGGAERLSSDTSARRLDGSGNPIPRVPAGYSDDPGRLWTMRFRRSSTVTRLTSACAGNASASNGQLYYMTVPLPPSS